MKFRCATVLCVLLAAAGCGQRGPLYLPGDPNEGRIVLPGEELPTGTGEGAAEEPQQPDEAEVPVNPDDQNAEEQNPEDHNPEDDEQ